MTVKKPNSRGGADEVEEENEGSLASLSPSPPSSETESSPRRRRKAGKKKETQLHSQVLRVREEDLHIGEDGIIMEGFCGKVVNNHLNGVGSPLKSGVNLSRPSMLPCSPLRGKIATINNLRLDQDVGGF